jgi:GNAT superfamily N-acetyltransferase
MVVTLKPIGISDIGLVDEILDSLHGYSMKVDGVPKLTDGARHLLTATPDGIGHECKHSFAILSGSAPIGVVDIIRGFPIPSTAFIGLLAVTEQHQRRGLGRAAFHAVEIFAGSQLGASKLRLAVVATNPVAGFWLKMGFRETGEVKPYLRAHVTSAAHFFEKQLG